MKILMAMMLVLALPLVLVAEDGWRTWTGEKPKTTTTRSASSIDWLPDAAVKAESVHPLAQALDAGFPPRSAALAAKEPVVTLPPPVETESPKVETPQYITVPVYDRRGRQIGTQQQLARPQTLNMPSSGYSSSYSSGMECVGSS